MSRVHDMGGRFGDGPVTPEPEEVKFHADWHKRALALTLASGALGAWNLDMSRHARESIDPADYSRFSYYEKWIAALADLLVAQGLISRDELQGATPASAETSVQPLRANAVAGVLAKGAPADRPSEVTPRFAPGQAVKTLKHAENRLINGGHTRLPSYAAAAQGRVLRCHGAHILPDSNAHDMGECPEPLYAVAFPASELWTHPEHPRDEVVLDLWQSYLEPA